MEDLPKVTRCRSCGATVWWGETKNGKRCPYDAHLMGVDRDTLDPVYERTDISHFQTCVDAKQWTKRRT